LEEGRIDRPRHVLLNGLQGWQRAVVGGLSRGAGARTRIEALNELGVKLRRPGAAAAAWAALSDEPNPAKFEADSARASGPAMTNDMGAPDSLYDVCRRVGAQATKARDRSVCGGGRCP